MKLYKMIENFYNEKLSRSKKDIKDKKYEKLTLKLEHKRALLKNEYKSIKALIKEKKTNKDYLEDILVEIDEELQVVDKLLAKVAKKVK